MKNINFQVKFHVFCIKKKSLFYTNSCEPGGVNCRPHYYYGPNAKPERAAREGRQIQRTTLQNWDKTELQIGNTQRKQAYISNPS